MKILSTKLPLSKLSLSLSLCFVVASANAGDMGPVESELWAGGYFGLHAGSGAGHVKQTFNESSNDLSSQDQVGFFNSIAITTTSYGKHDGNVTGSLANLFIGYNFHRPGCKFVYGAQLEGTLFSDIALKGIGSGNTNQVQTATIIQPSETIILTTTTTRVDTSEQVDELRSTFNFIARGGYLARENTLLYALGGAVEGHFVIPDGRETIGDKRNQWETGWTAGAGVEYKFCDYLSFVAEYRYMSFSYNRNGSNSSNVFNQTNSGEGVLNITNSSLSRLLHTDFNYNLGQIGIVYRV